MAAAGPPPGGDRGGGGAGPPPPPAPAPAPADADAGAAGQGQGAESEREGRAAQGAAGPEGGRAVALTDGGGTVVEVPDGLLEVENWGVRAPPPPRPPLKLRPGGFPWEPPALSPRLACPGPHLPASLPLPAPPGGPLLTRAGRADRRTC